MKLASGAKSDVGRWRQVNEDAFVADPPLFAVADGMGGAAAGDVASSTAVEVIRDETGAGSNDLANILKSVNSAIYGKARSDTSLQGMGTTCTLLNLGDETARIAHVGDSRAYLFRDGELRQLTEDHTLVERMVKEGRLRREDARRHPQRSVIMRALGVDEDVEVDTLSVDVREGDRLLLCSDGLSSMIEEPTIADALAQEADPQHAADRLVDLANEAGGEDNVTVIVIDLVSDDHRRASATKAEEARPAATRSRSRRGVKIALLVVLILVAAVVGARFALANSWFVGVNEDGFVTIYRGVPDEIAGLSFSDTEQETDLALDDLPEFKRVDVEEGISADSREDAEQTVADLRDLSSDPEFGPRPSPSPSPTRRDGGATDNGGKNRKP